MGLGEVKNKYKKNFTACYLLINTTCDESRILRIFFLPRDTRALINYASALYIYPNQ